MTPKREYYAEYQSFSAPEEVALGDGKLDNVVEAVGVGTIRLNMLFDASNSKDSNMILHPPRLSCNLFSVREVVKRGHTVNFGQLRCLID